MKNIHLLPTDKPSPLFYIDENLFYLPEEKNRTNWNKELVKCQNIYITNDEEIKEGDWIFEIDNSTINIADKNYYRNEFDFKIILTTDTDLIKDGVQAIDDEFLEWFVKNPSCEEVEVYKFISGIYFCTNPMIPKEEPKQETLEEVAENKYPLTNVFHLQLNTAIRTGFIEGAKWQQQQNKNLYSEEEVYEKLHNLMTSIKLDGLVINDDMDLKQWFNQNKKK